MRGWAEAPGSCGELVQGQVGGRAFHVSCPINLTARAEVTITARPGVRCRPPRPKAAAAVKLTLRRLGYSEAGAEATLTSDIPIAKGMASSTADLAAASQATAAALGTTLTPAEIAQICLAVEPTDGTVFPEVVAFDHEVGGLIRPVGPAPPLFILVIDDGTELDTVSYTATKRRYTPDEQRRLAEVLDMAGRGVADGDLSLIGRAATDSSLINQGLLSKRELDRFIRLANQVGAYGVNVAHSGTVVGILHDRDPDAVALFFRRRLRGYRLRSVAVRGGGTVVSGRG